MLIDLIAGARPNFMKVAPIIRALEARAAGGGPLRFPPVHTPWRVYWMAATSLSACVLSRGVAAALTLTPSRWLFRAVSLARNSRR